MKQLTSLIRKEWHHILRDRKTLLILLGMPVAQIVLFGFALTNEVKNTRFAVWDGAQTAASHRLTEQMDASPYFELATELYAPAQIEEVFRKGGVGLVMVLPRDFDRNLGRPGGASVQLIADASDPNHATTITTYASSILRRFVQGTGGMEPRAGGFDVEVRMLYNPQLKGAYSFVPGVMALVLMLVCTMMTAITIVREKETGTMEVLLVSPVSPVRVVLAKAVPYLLLSLLNIVTILLLSVWVLGVPIRGSLPLLLAESVLFTITSLSLGLLISTRTDSQQTAMFISLAGLFLPTVMLSGFLFPIENMPLPLRLVSNLIPSKWFYHIVKSIMIQGLPFAYVWKETLILLGMTLFLLIISIRNFKIRLA